MHRFFVPPAWIGEEKVTVQDPGAHQIQRVLRLSAGDRVVLLDDSGWEYVVELEMVRPGRVAGRVVEKRLCDRETRRQVVLYPALLKAGPFEMVLQKCTELGVSRFAPIVTSRSVAGPASGPGGRMERWRRIIREAAEQSGRCRLPVLADPVPFEEAVEEAGRRGVCILPWECAGSGSLKEAMKDAGDAGEPLNLFVGPEGGFSDFEAQAAERYNCRIVTLGRRILRAETAAIAVIAIVLHELGELSGKLEEDSIC